MEGHSVISPDVLARYAADAAREVRGVHGLVGRNDGVKVTRDDERVAVELHLALEWGATRERWERRCRRASPTTSPGWPTSVPTPST